MKRSILDKLKESWFNSLGQETAWAYQRNNEVDQKFEEYVNGLSNFELIDVLERTKA